MNLLLALIGALIIVFAISGYRIGLVRRVVEFVGLVASFLLATNLAPAFSDDLADLLGSSERIALYVGAFLLFLAGLVLTRLLAWLLSKTLRISILGWVDRLGGTVFGILIGVVLASVILIALSQLPGGEAIHEACREQPVARAIYGAAPRLYEVFRNLDDDDKRFLENLLDRAKDHASLPAADRAPARVAAAAGTSSDPRG